MTEHHEGAITLANDEEADGAFKAAVGLARGISSANRPGISTTSALLGQ